MPSSAEATATFDLDRIPSEDVIIFEEGLVGLPEWKRFVLVTLDEEEAGVGLLQSIESKDVSLLVTNPLQFLPDYAIELSEVDRTLLHLEGGVKPLILTTLSVHDQMITTNLVGPLVINPERRTAKQIVLTDSEYSTRYPVVEVEVEGPGA